jgi:hypothetical protein
MGPKTNCTKIAKTFGEIDGIRNCKQQVAKEKPKPSMPKQTAILVEVAKGKLKFLVLK